MLFHEIYGSYFSAVSAIIKEACDGSLTIARITDIVQKKAFSESMLTIPSALKNEDWPLITADLKTPIKKAPHMPLTTLEKRWLAAVVLDPRVKLFLPDNFSADIAEPLFDPQKDVVYFDRYTDGDPFSDPSYRKCFRSLLYAIKKKMTARIFFESGRGRTHSWTVIPYKLEYSEKDDKFRVLLISSGKKLRSVNVARINKVDVLENTECSLDEDLSFDTAELEFLLTDERNALERVLLHFSHLKKETTMLDDAHYLVRMEYQKEDETEILIRILSFGPVIKVISPQSFVELIKERLKKQQYCEHV